MASLAPAAALGAQSIWGLSNRLSEEKAAKGVRLASWRTCAGLRQWSALRCSTSRCPSVRIVSASSRRYPQATSGVGPSGLAVCFWRRVVQESRVAYL